MGIILHGKCGDSVENEKFVVRTRKSYGEHQVVSCRMPVELIRKLDEIGSKTSRTRNELILRCVEYALDRLEVVEE